MHFGFKENHSTAMCTVILREVIQNYIQGHRNVYCGLLDASKAFDKVQLVLKIIHYITCEKCVTS